MAPREEGRGRGIIEGARVVYLGPSTRKAVTLRGCIAVERLESEPGRVEIIKHCDKEASITCYDFSTHDSRQRLIVQREELSMTQHTCFNCGEPVTDRDYDYIGHQRVFTCGARACQKEIDDANRAAQEEAAWDAREDGYSRYWS